MPAEQEKFQKAVEVALEAVMFENWIRFYFIAESTDKDAEGNPILRIEIPEQGMKKIEELYPDSLPLAQYVNGREASFETSRTAVCTQIVHTIDGKLVQQGASTGIIDSKAFQSATQLFNIWVQAYEEKLDEQFLEFGMWVRIFNEWRASESGKEIAEKINMAAPTASPSVQ